MDENLARSVTPFHLYLWSSDFDITAFRSHLDHLERVIEVRDSVYKEINTFRQKVKPFQASKNRFPKTFITRLVSFLRFIYDDREGDKFEEKKEVLRNLAKTLSGCKRLIAFGLLFGKRVVEKRRKPVLHTLADEAAILVRALDESFILTKESIKECYGAVGGAALAEDFREGWAPQEQRHLGMLTGQGLNSLLLLINVHELDGKRPCKRARTAVPVSHSPNSTPSIMAIPDDAAVEDSCRTTLDGNIPRSNDTSQIRASSLAPTVHEGRLELASTQFDVLEGRDSVVLPVEHAGAGMNESHADLLALTAQTYNGLHSQVFDPTSTGLDYGPPRGLPDVRHGVNNTQDSPLLLLPSSVQAVPLLSEGGYVQAPENTTEVSRFDISQHNYNSHSLTHAFKSGLNQWFSDYNINVMKGLETWNMGPNTPIVMAHYRGNGSVVADINLGDSDGASIESFVADINGRRKLATKVRTVVATHVLVTLCDAAHFIDQVYYEPLATSCSQGYGAEAATT